MNPINPKDFFYLMPLGILIVVGLLLVLAEAFTVGRRRHFLMQLTVAGCAAAAFAAIYLWRSLGDGQVSLFGGMLLADRLGMFLTVLFSVTTGFVAMISAGHQQEYDWESGEYYGLMMLATSGMTILAMAGDLVSIFIGIETMSLGVYVMCGSHRHSRRSSEAAMKYFLMGAFATGFLLYGMALLYGAAGTTDLSIMANALSAQPSQPLIFAAVMLLVVAFGFKLALVPFHMWAPDAYEGAPTPVTGYMAAAVKAAAFAAFLRLFGTALGGEILPFGRMGWTTIFAVLAAVTMTVGNLAALRQESIKRMLAYSSISHAGIIMVGVVAAGVDPMAGGLSAVLFYLAAYSATTLGAFAVVAWIGSREHERTLVSDFSGLAAAHPGAAAAMTIFMLSFGGIPPTAGFVGKFVIFKTALQAYDQQLLWLVVVGVLNSVISIFYYLRVVMAMYFRDSVGEFRLLPGAAVGFAVVATALLVLQMGIMPGSWLSFAGG